MAGFTPWCRASRQEWLNVYYMISGPPPKSDFTGKIWDVSLGDGLDAMYDMVLTEAVRQVRRR